MPGLGRKGELSRAFFHDEPSNDRRRIVSATESARSSLRDWYWDKLGSKVARAAADGRVDATQAAELHRLMAQLLEDDSRQAIGVESTTAEHVDGQVVR